MKINKELINQYDTISTFEIKQDIFDTKQEIKQFQNELDVLMKNKQANKLNIYFRTGQIKSRENFIKKLQFILDYRKSEIKIN